MKLKLIYSKYISSDLGQDCLFSLKNAVLCIFLQRQTSKHSFLVEIEPAALNLLVNLEVKFLMNAEQAGLFFLCIELLSKRKREY